MAAVGDPPVVRVLGIDDDAGDEAHRRSIDSGKTRALRGHPWPQCMEARLELTLPGRASQRTERIVGLPLSREAFLNGASGTGEINLVAKLRILSRAEAITGLAPGSLYQDHDHAVRPNNLSRYAHSPNPGFEIKKTSSPPTRLLP